MSDYKPKRPPSRGPSSPRIAMDALAGADPATGNPGGSIVRRALWLDELDRRLRPYLPPSIAAHARLANFERGRLVYVVDAPVWRAKLRLAAPELLDAARSIGLDTAELVVKTTVPNPAAAPVRKAKPMSAATQAALQAALASLNKPDPSGSNDAS
ncbi:MULTISPECIES: DUF721 domain-containing protein [Lysobacter]|uniref:DUF721 domain-containing protein n=2 Tax=Lysobacter gummosus TaxID=262324 RepID=A0ABY3X7H7_9GAMM|nr:MULTISPECIES: DUF721 domain-containing protein [Lysobacter]MBT2747909.1 DUF721 domain-containing protein [Lysobacter sp. ISL-42]MBT2753751.1 DUF721 domain-containing protein [Lysobacter sp. ISL-50]MBT2779039.1 DUF721 domain-containing protein [Lysobacter sp. ISL-54]UJB20215.1 DUF721 domain-containing protein [Lysobacter capsici]UJQ30671.1 DUF721 domain-containing protein [Lysobacter gummosus]